MAGGTARPPVKTGGRRDVERQLGAPPLSETPPPEGDDDFALPEGYENPYTTHRRTQASNRAANRAGARANRAAPRRSAPRPTPATRRPSPSRSRPGRPTLSNPTGSRGPIGFDGEGIAGAFFGAVFYALLISVADYGAKGPLLWFKAKFMNQAAPKKGT
jgi:hypothetical protein